MAEYLKNVAQACDLPYFVITWEFLSDFWFVPGRSINLCRLSIPQQVYIVAYLQSQKRLI